MWSRQFRQDKTIYFLHHSEMVTEQSGFSEHLNFKRFLVEVN